MTVLVFIPSRTYSFTDVDSAELETISGRMTLLTNHIDSAGTLATGLMRIRHASGEDEFAGLDGGTFVKIGQRLMVSTPRAVIGAELGNIHRRLQREIDAREQQQKDAQRALARLEIEMARSIFRGDGHL